MTKKESLIVIGGNERLSVAYNVQTQEVYVRKISQIETAKIFSFCILGPVSGNVFYEASKSAHVDISPINLLIFGAIFLTVLFLILGRLAIFITEYWLNRRKYVKVEKIGTMTDDQFHDIFDDIRDGKGFIIMSVCLIVFGICAGSPLAGAYLSTLDFPLGVMYMMTIFLIDLGIFSCWYSIRSRRLKQYVIELYRNKNELKEVES